MKTESVIVLPVVARETVYLDWSILDASGEEIARQILFLKQAHAIARALNTQTQLLEACKAAVDAMTRLESRLDVLSQAGPLTIVQQNKAQLRTAIAAAGKEKV